MTTARARRHPLGVELCIQLGDDLVWSRVYPPDRLPMLNADIEIKRSEFINVGWTSVDV